MSREIKFFTFTAVFFTMMLLTSVAASDGSTASLTDSSAKPTSVDYVEYLVAKPVGVKTAAVAPEDQLPILPEFSIQSQSPQPIVIRNYYLTAQAKQEVLPFWQGPRPLRLRNQFAR